MKAFVGNTVWAAFHVDLVGADLRMTGEPEDVPPLAQVVMPDVEQHGYRAYPLVDHVADKVCAMIEQHGTTRSTIDPLQGPRRSRGHRPRRAGSGRAATHRSPLRARRRGLQLPGRFTIPDRGLWQPGYAAEAGRSLLAMARTLDEATATITPFLDPLLDGTARGRWDPQGDRWTS